MLRNAIRLRSLQASRGVAVWEHLYRGEYDLIRIVFDPSSAQTSSLYRVAASP